MYVFGNLPTEPIARGDLIIPAATPEDRAISDAAISRWTTFAKSGDPGADWPRFGAKETTMEFGVGGPKPQVDFRKASLDLVEQVGAAAGR